MKANPLACALLVLLAVAVQLPAQNSNTDKAPRWEDTQPVSPSSTNATALIDFRPESPKPASTTIVPPAGFVLDEMPFDSSHVKTTAGKVYDKIQVSKVEPDGVVVSYTPEKGGMAITKLFFEELPKNWRDHYGYSSQKAEEFRKQKFNAQVNQSRQWIVDEQNLKALKAQQAQEEAEQAAKEAQRQKEILDLEIRIRTLEAEERTALATERMAAAQEGQLLNQNLESARIANELETLNSQLRMLRYGY
jgi:hypothetical protein